MFDYRIVKVLEVGQNGGEWLKFADVDGDGQKEIVWRQSGGMFDSDAYKTSGHGYITDENQYLLQLTCMKQDGRILWQRGKPWTQERPYNTHGGNQMTAIRDINGDGRLELVYIFRGELHMLDAATGAHLRSIPLITDAISIIGFQGLGAAGCNIILKSIGTSPYGYGRPLLAYDADLNLLWQDTTGGNGHALVFRDVDGDGKDEILEGYRLIDDDGRVLWSHEWPSHADHIAVQDLDGDGVEEVVYCTDNEDFIIVNGRGEMLLHRTDFPHPQTTSIGRFVAGEPGYQIFMNNRATHGGAVMMDCHGRTLWDFPCNGYSETLPNPEPGGLDLILHKPGPGRLPAAIETALVQRAAELGYEGLPIQGNAGFEPFILDGEGRVLYTFPFLEASLDVTRWGIDPRLKMDHGAGFGLTIDDVDGDGVDEFVFANRWKAWFLKR
ncbi:MAG: hypothetical protein GXY76_19925 [Chloroflexi bacterium]|nr:hypothetical protein [Chloroflexota bacterium]